MSIFRALSSRLYLPSGVKLRISENIKQRLEFNNYFYQTRINGKYLEFNLNNNHFVEDLLSQKEYPNRLVISDNYLYTTGKSTIPKFIYRLYYDDIVRTPSKKSNIHLGEITDNMKMLTSNDISIIFKVFDDKRDLYKIREIVEEYVSKRCVCMINSNNYLLTALNSCSYSSTYHRFLERNGENINYQVYSEDFLSQFIFEVLKRKTNLYHVITSINLACLRSFNN